MKPPRRNRQPSRKMTHPGSKPANSRGTYKVRNEIVTKRNEINENETKRNEINKNETKRNEINEMKTK
jgi:hypothetical protein